MCCLQSHLVILSSCHSLTRHERMTRTNLTLLEVMKGRRSVRRYTAQPVPRELIEQVLEAARWAPSPHGRQPWRFVVLTRTSGKTRLADAMAAEWERNLAMD